MKSPSPYPSPPRGEGTGEGNGKNMPTFKYRVRDRSGKATTGTIEAPTIEMAGNHLYQTGYFPISIEEESASVSLNLSDLLKRFQKVKPEELIVFSQQLSA